MNAAWKVIGGVIILFALIIVAFSYKDVFPFLSGTAAERLESLWERDTISLAGSKSLPPQFLSIKEINFTYGSQTSENWMKAIQVPIRKKLDGKFRLEVFVDHWAEGKDYGAVIQYQLVDLNSNDTIWELGRTFTLGQRDDLMPERQKAKVKALQTPSPNK